MSSRIIGSITSNDGVKYFVRYVQDDNLLEISTSQIGPWFIIRDNYSLDNSALEIAKEYIDNSVI
jgi:hypothetical protein